MEEKESGENLFFACQNVKEKKNDMWYLESGCSNYMTPKKIFLDMNNSFISKVKIGNGVAVEVKGKGSIGVQMTKERKVIHDVLFVSELSQNLLGLG